MTYNRSWFEMFLEDYGHGRSNGGYEKTGRLTDEEIIARYRVNLVYVTEGGYKYTIVRLMPANEGFPDDTGSMMVEAENGARMVKSKGIFAIAYVKAFSLRILPENQMSWIHQFKMCARNIYQEIARLYKGITQ